MVAGLSHTCVLVVLSWPYPTNGLRPWPNYRNRHPVHQRHCQHMPSMTTRCTCTVPVEHVRTVVWYGGVWPCIRVYTSTGNSALVIEALRAIPVHTVISMAHPSYPWPIRHIHGQSCHGQVMSYQWPVMSYQWPVMSYQWPVLYMASVISQASVRYGQCYISGQC